MMRGVVFAPLAVAALLVTACTGELRLRYVA
jgi:hypothetical protein